MLREFPVGADEHGSRLETFLRRRLGLSRPSALKALRKGWIRVDGRRAKGARPLSAGEVVKVTNYALPLPALEAAPAPIPALPQAWVERARASIRLEDEDVVVVAKPAGEVVHRGTGHEHGWCDAVSCALGGGSLVPVGRLDRDTSGLLLLARHRLPARRLFAALKAGEVRRTYVALVAGRLRGERGEIDLPLAKEGPEGDEQMHAQPDGKPARTMWRALASLGGTTLLEVEIETGRTHQIRAHLQAVGHPLLGDPRYGTERSRGLSEVLGVPRLFLHAERLSFPHPTSGEAVALREPLPPDLGAALRDLDG